MFSMFFLLIFYKNFFRKTRIKLVKKKNASLGEIANT